MEMDEIQIQKNRLLTNIETAIETRDKPLQAKSYGHYAYFLQKQNILKEAVEYFRMSISHFEELGNKKSLSFLYNDTGLALFNLQDHSKALHFFYLSLKTYEELEDPKGIAAVCLNIGNVNHALSKLEEALQFYFRAGKLSRELNDELMTAYSDLNTGAVFLDLEKFSDAETKFNSALIFFTEHKDAYHCLKINNNLGVLHLKQTNYPEAILYFENSLRLAKEIASEEFICAALENLGQINIALDHFDAASLMLEHALNIALSLNNKELIKNLYKHFFVLYEKKDDHKNALAYYKKYINYKEEIINLNNLQQLGELELKYQLSQTEKENAIATIRNTELKEVLDKLSVEKKISENLLLNILPEEIAEELKLHGQVVPRQYEKATVMFIDIKNFSKHAENLSAKELVNEIDFLYKSFDEIIEKHQIEKIKTIGDAYMCAAGLPLEDDDNPIRMVQAALEITTFMTKSIADRKAKRMPFFEVRLGIHTGHLVAGVVGKKKYAYDVWGDTVNIAARMQQAGEVNKINITSAVYDHVKDAYPCTFRGNLSIKNKDNIDMYFVD